MAISRCPGSMAGPTMNMPSDSRVFAGIAVAVMRLNPDGSPDESFGNDGLAHAHLSEDRSAFATDLAVQPDGRIVVGIITLPPDWWDTGRSGFALLRLNPDGTVDSSFGNDGFASANFGGSTEEISRIALQNDGRIVVVGQSNARGTAETMFARFEANGELDESFGTGPVSGAALVNLGGYPYEDPWLTLQADGKYVACTTRNTGIPNDFRVLAIRVNADGSLDTTYGTGGVLQTTSALAVLGACQAMPNGTILLALAALVFVPIRYVYPSRTPTLRTLTLALGAIWAVLMLAMLWEFPAVSRATFWASLVFPAYYTVLSLVLNFRRRRGAG